MKKKKTSDISIPPSSTLSSSNLDDNRISPSNHRYQYSMDNTPLSSPPNYSPNPVLAPTSLNNIANIYSQSYSLLSNNADSPNTLVNILI